jgi:hypothetical protein
MGADPRWAPVFAAAGQRLPAAAAAGQRLPAAAAAGNPIWQRMAFLEACCKPKGAKAEKGDEHARETARKDAQEVSYKNRSKMSHAEQRSECTQAKTLPLIH